MNANRQQAEVWPVGWHINEELVGRLAEESGCSSEELQGVIDGTIELTPPVAAGLARAFGTSAGLWLTLDRRHREWLAQQHHMRDATKKVQP